MLLLLNHSIGSSCKSYRLARLKEALDAANVQYSTLTFDHLEVESPLTSEQRHRVEEALDGTGIELISDRSDMLIEEIKRRLEDLTEPADASGHISIRHHLMEKLPYSYSHLSKLFVEAVGISPDRYLIEQKIERAKHLIRVEDATLTEIAFRLGYSSVAHLSHQFHQVTGVTATQWRREMKTVAPLPLDGNGQYEISFNHSDNTATVNTHL